MQAIHSRAETLPKLIPVFFDADAGSVIMTARDCIHAGWQLLHHPLYGNYRPYQQPYRSLLLKAPAGPSNRSSHEAPHHHPIDETSLHLIEEALLVYSDNTVLAPELAPASLREACARIDYELMRLPLEQAGIFYGGHPVHDGN